MFEALSNSKPSRASVVLLLRFKFTEARSEGLIELKLVRKPPKVSRGSGGGAHVRDGSGSPDFLGALSYNQQFGGWSKAPLSGLSELDT